MDRLMQLSRLNLDANSTTASAEWRHWFKTFENYLEVLSQSTTEEFQLDRLKVLVNSVTHQVYQYIEECESYDSAVTTLCNLYSKTYSKFFLDIYCLQRSKNQNSRMMIFCFRYKN